MSILDNYELLFESIEEGFPSDDLHLLYKEIRQHNFTHFDEIVSYRPEDWILTFAWIDYDCKGTRELLYILINHRFDSFNKLRVIVTEDELQNSTEWFILFLITFELEEDYLDLEEICEKTDDLSLVSYLREKLKNELFSVPEIWVIPSYKYHDNNCNHLINLMIRLECSTEIIISCFKFLSTLPSVIYKNCYIEFCNIKKLDVNVTYLSELINNNSLQHYLSELIKNKSLQHFLMETNANTDIGKLNTIYNECKTNYYIEQLLYSKYIIIEMILETKLSHDVLKYIVRPYLS